MICSNNSNEKEAMATKQTSYILSKLISVDERNEIKK